MEQYLSYSYRGFLPRPDLVQFLMILGASVIVLGIFFYLAIVIVKTVEKEKSNG